MTLPLSKATPGGVLVELSREVVQRLAQDDQNHRALDLSNHEIAVVCNLHLLPSTLCVVNLSYNQLTRLDFSKFACLSALKELYLARNQISRVENGFTMAEKQVHLKVLDLSYNCLDTSNILDQLETIHMPSLQHLLLRGNRYAQQRGYRAEVASRLNDLQVLDNVAFIRPTKESILSMIHSSESPLQLISPLSAISPLKGHTMAPSSLKSNPKFSTTLAPNTSSNVTSPHYFEGEARHQTQNDHPREVLVNNVEHATTQTGYASPEMSYRNTKESLQGRQQTPVKSTSRNSNQQQRNGEKLSELHDNLSAMFPTTPHSFQAYDSQDQASYSGVSTFGSIPMEPSSVRTVAELQSPTQPGTFLHQMPTRSTDVVQEAKIHNSRNDSRVEDHDAVLGDLRALVQQLSYIVQKGVQQDSSSESLVQHGDGDVVDGVIVAADQTEAIASPNDSHLNMISKETHVVSKEPEPSSSPTKKLDPKQLSVKPNDIPSPKIFHGESVSQTRLQDLEQAEPANKQAYIEFETISKQYQTCCAENQHLKLENEQLKQNIQATKLNMSSRVNELQNELQKMQEELRRSNRAQSRAESQTQDAKLQVQLLQAEVKKAASQVRALENIVKTQEKVCVEASSTSEHSPSQKTLQAWRNKLFRALVQIEVAALSEKGALSKCAQAEKKSKDMATLISNLTNELESSRKQVKKQEDIILDMQSRHEAQLCTLRGSLAKERSKSMQLVATIGEQGKLLDDWKDTFEEHIKQATQQLNERVMSCNKHVQTLQGCLISSQQQVAKMKDQMMTKDLEFETVKAGTMKLEVELRSKEAALDEQRSKVVQLEGVVQQLSNEMKKVKESSLRDISDTVEKIERTHGTIEAQLRQEKAALERDVSKLTVSLRHTQRDLAKATEQKTLEVGNRVAYLEDRLKRKELELYNTRRERSVLMASLREFERLRGRRKPSDTNVEDMQPQDRPEVSAVASQTPASNATTTIRELAAQLLS